jgi:hypothetical protein
MARVPALGVAPIRRKRVGRGVIVKLGVCPSARVRESLGILFDKRNRFQGVQYHHGIGGLRILFRCALIFATLEPSGKCLPLSGMPALQALMIAGLRRSP